MPMKLLEMMGGLSEGDQGPHIQVAKSNTSVGFWVPEQQVRS